jgi:hypothetical protein
MLKLNKATLFPRVYHAVFRDGILLSRRTLESGSDVCDCLFMDGSSPRTILTSCLLLFNEERTTSLYERRAIRRYLLHRKFEVNVPEPDFQIADAESEHTEPDLEPSRTLTELEEQELTA